MTVPDYFMAYIPKMIRNDRASSIEFLNDINLVRSVYPQGQLINVNIVGSLKNLINYVGKERACVNAQNETQDIFTNALIPKYYEELIKQGKDNLAQELKPYVKRLRCSYPTYKCPRPCGHPRVERDF
jgi:hypothetical protein